MRIRAPQSLAGRFALLLVGALVAANLVAILLLSSERARFQREAREAREIERLVALVPALDAVPAEQRERIARTAAGRFARVSVDGAAAVARTGDDASARALAVRIATALGSDPGDVRVDRRGDAVQDRPFRPRRADRWRARFVASVRLADGQWLNVEQRRRGRPSRGGLWPLLLVLMLSLVAVLGVGLWFVRRLTRPIRAMSEAAGRAGRGDHDARVPQTGARELREMAEAFNDMQDRIARFDRDRTRMIAAVGHDLRTPITSLRIRAEMLDEDAREPMVRTLDEMRVMADGLLAFARGEAEGEETVRLDLRSLLERLCAEANVPLHASDAAPVLGRPVSLSRAFGNLLDNASRYAERARVRLSRGDGVATVMIEDDGPGIPPDRIGEMLEPFTRLDPSRSADTGGAGLGLSIARSIVRAHGGELTLAKLKDGGLAATVELPLADDAPGNAPEVHNPA